MAISKDFSFNTPSGVNINSKIIKGYVALDIASDYWILSLFSYYGRAIKTLDQSTLIIPISELKR